MKHTFFSIVLTGLMFTGFNTFTLSAVPDPEAFGKEFIER